MNLPHLPSRPQACADPHTKDGERRRATVGLVCLVCYNRQAHVDSTGDVGAVGKRENSDWMFGLTNESVPENYSESDKNEHVNEGGTDRRLFNCYVIFPNHSNKQMFS